MNTYIRTVSTISQRHNRDNRVSREELLTLELPFEGFYESIHNDAFDSILQYDLENIPEQHWDELSKVFWNLPWKLIYQAYAKKYAERYTAALNAAVEREHGFTNLFDTNNLDINLISPKYYNFETDCIEVNIPKTSVEWLMKLLTSKEHLPTLQKHIDDRHTSYSGFCSFINTDLQSSDWSIEHLAEYPGQVETLLIALIDTIDEDDLQDAMREESMNELASEIIGMYANDYYTLYEKYKVNL